MSELSELQGDLDARAIARIIGVVVLVTPEMAAAWLRDTNRDNRTVRRVHVSALAHAMTACEWRVTHQGIAFSKSGRLIDGQHRLHAIIKSGVSTTLCVFRGLDDDLFGALDRGSKRTVRDALRMDGRVVDPLSFLCKVMLDRSRWENMRSISPDEASAMFNVYGAELIDILNAATVRSNTGRAPAPVRAALAIRLKHATPAEYQMLLAQWRALALLEVRDMDETTSSMLKRLDSVGSDRGVDTQFERAAIGWIGWNPRARDLSRITVRDVDGMVANIRRVVHADMQVALAGGAKPTAAVIPLARVS